MTTTEWRKISESPDRWVHLELGMVIEVEIETFLARVEPRCGHTFKLVSVDDAMRALAIQDGKCLRCSAGTQKDCAAFIAEAQRQRDMLARAALFLGLHSGNLVDHRVRPFVLEAVNFMTLASEALGMAADIISNPPKS